MLVLTRHVGEGFRIGNAIKVIVLGAKGNQVRIGNDADRVISVHREEVYQRIKMKESLQSEGHQSPN